MAHDAETELATGHAKANAASLEFYYRAIRSDPERYAAKLQRARVDDRRRTAERKNDPEVYAAFRKRENARWRAWYAKRKGGR